MIKKICFLENSKKQYDGSHRCNPILRGAELAIINYSEELAKKGYEVFVLNNCLKACEINKVKYFNINNKNNKFECDVEFDSSKPNGDHKRILDMSRAYSHGFKNSVDIDDGLEQTIDWYLSL